ncbi:PadR family transcriptional regulator [Frigoribacterium sp. CG_9.8]|uniref:PadR family transcriptional regulator n=1 Tax=Frigoribacterium sp. CG_9.8 TaxID=2787733 RepID=UPI0018CA0D3F|nr:PadR family transcriptional regulator [Frigoribacterium sp. CG_9.8]MBG6109058.1 PadR family transcriptional regulator PadR [Frigoribacterium sp. CG_9.8]
MNSEHQEEVQLTSAWPSDWMRAVLGMFALRAVEQGASYGYAIISDLEANGLGTVKGGTLYPLLSRYESAGFVAVEWRPGDAGPGRKYFSLTDRGRSELERTRSEWLRFTANGNDYLNTAPTGRTDTP